MSHLLTRTVTFITLFLPLFAVASPANAEDTCTVDAQTLSPGQWQRVSNTPFVAEGDNAAIWVYIRIGDEHVAVPAWASANDGFDFKVPALLTKPWDNVAIDEFWLTDGEAGCTIDGLSRGAMVRRSGTLDALLLANALGNQAQLRAIGIDPETRTYVETGQPVTDREVIRPMINAKRTFRDYKTQASTIATDPDMRYRLNVLEAYLVASGMAERVLENAQWQDDFARDREESFSREHGHLRHPPGLIQRINTPKLRTDGSVMSRFAPKTAAELSAMLMRQMEGAAGNAPNVAFTRDTAATLFGMGSVLAGAAKAKPLAFAYNAAAQKLFVESMQYKVQEGLFPETLHQMSVIGGPFQIGTSTVPTQGVVTNLYVTPRAKGVNAAQLIADVAINFIPFAGSARGFKGIVKRRIGSSVKSLGKAGKDAVDTAKTQAVKTLTDAKPAAKSADVVTDNADSIFSSQMNLTIDLFEGIYEQVIGMISGDTKYGDVAVIDPFHYPKVDILEPGYYRVSGNMREHLDWDPDVGTRELEYYAKKVGKVRARFETMPGKFANDHNYQVKTIWVQEPAILVDPMEKIVMPGTPITYDATVVGVAVYEPDQRRIKVMTEEGFSATKTGSEMEGDLETVTYRVETASSPDAYPSTVTFLSEHYQDLLTERVINTPDIEPRVSCVLPGESVKFSARDEVGKPVRDARFFLDGPGRLTPDGTYTAPNGGMPGRTEVTVKLGTNADAIVDETTFDIGCTCDWEFQLAGQTAKGKVLSVSQLSGGEAPGYTIMTVDGDHGSVGLAGEGSALSPKGTGATVQLGDRSFVGGINFFSDPTADCQAPKLDARQWVVMGDRWLQGHVAGHVIEVSDLPQTCPPLRPFSFRFTADLGGDNDASTSTILGGLARGGFGASSPEAGKLLGMISGMGLTGSACIETGE